MIGAEKDVLELLRQQKADLLGYVDKTEADIDVPYFGTDEQFMRSYRKKTPLVLALDDPDLKSRLANIYLERGFVFTNLISSHATIFSPLPENAGLIVQNEVYLSKDVKIGRFVKLNVGSKVFHDSRVGDFSTFAPGAIALGHTTVGECCYLGCNSVIRNKISIADNTTIGFASAVTKEIPEHPGRHIYFGNPARRRKISER